jgi:hypothetical protein
MDMAETTEQRQIRLALFASERVEAKSDYQLAQEAVLQRTARLRSERLAIEAARQPTCTKQAPRLPLNIRRGRISAIQKVAGR